MAQATATSAEVQRPQREQPHTVADTGHWSIENQHVRLTLGPSGPIALTRLDGTANTSFGMHLGWYKSSDGGCSPPPPAPLPRTRRGAEDGDGDSKSAHKSANTTAPRWCDPEEFSLQKSGAYIFRPNSSQLNLLDDAISVEVIPYAHSVGGTHPGTCCRGKSVSQDIPPLDHAPFVATP